jgi:2-polyprenyl-3-methyl-5-hydroxy-6-metoxy-1,4-benzoquinol methylase
VSPDEPEVVLEDAPCPLCAGSSLALDEPVLIGRDLLHEVPGEFAVVRCRACGLMRTNPRPSPSSIGQFYPDHYGPYLSSRIQGDPPPQTRIRRALRVLFKRVFRFNTDNIPELPPGRMLEIGCASGNFLHRMAKDGWDVKGIEFSTSAAKTALDLGYEVHIGPLETAPVPGEPFDLIVGWMVLEHLHDPLSGLRKLRECAKADTWLVLSVPNAGSVEFCVFKQYWYALQLPTHLHHFTPRTLENLLERAGWRLHKIYHQRTLGNLIASTGYVLRKSGFIAIGERLISLPDSPGRWNQYFYPLAWLLSLFGQTGRMTVWARPD